MKQASLPKGFLTFGQVKEEILSENQVGPSESISLTFEQGHISDHIVYIFLDNQIIDDRTPCF